MEADLRDACTGDSKLVRQLKEELGRERVSSPLLSNHVLDHVSICVELYGYEYVQSLEVM